MNIEKLKNIADYKSRVSLISLFSDDKISEDIETDIPDKLKKLHEHMKSLYTKGYLDCMRNATIGMSMEMNNQIYIFYL